MTTRGAHEERPLHTLQGPRHSSPLRRYKGCPIYREQSALAMEPWAQPAGQRYIEHSQQLLTARMHAHTHIHVPVHKLVHTHMHTQAVNTHTSTIISTSKRVNTQRYTHSQGKHCAKEHSREPPPLWVQLEVVLALFITTFMFALMGDKYVIGLRKSSKLSPCQALIRKYFVTRASIIVNQSRYEI